MSVQRADSLLDPFRLVKEHSEALVWLRNQQLMFERHSESEDRATWCECAQLGYEEAVRNPCLTTKTKKPRSH